jgi:hypothetical protein
MKYQLVVLTVLLTTSVFGLRAQGTFVNLGFENTTVPPGTPPGIVPTSAAFPGWTSPASTAAYDQTGLGGTAVLSLVSSNYIVGFPSIHFVPFEGRYTAVLQGGSAPDGPGMSLAQIGTVPGDALSLHFFAASFGENFTVSMNGQPQNFFRLQFFGSYYEYAADISGFAGQTTELRFTHPSQPGALSLFLDNISFSPVAVPEPSTWALLALGTAAFWCAARRRRK